MAPVELTTVIGEAERVVSEALEREAERTKFLLEECLQALEAGRFPASLASEPALRNLNDADLDRVASLWCDMNKKGLRSLRFFARQELSVSDSEGIAFAAKYVRRVHLSLAALAKRRLAP